MRVSLQTCNLSTNVQKTKRSTGNDEQTQTANFEQRTSLPAFGGFFLSDRGRFGLGKNDLTKFRNPFANNAPKGPTTDQINFIYSVDKVDRKIAIEYGRRFTDKVFKQAGPTGNVEDVKAAIRSCSLGYLLFDEEMTYLPATEESVWFEGRELSNPQVDFQNRYLAFVYMRDVGDNRQKLAYKALVEVLKEDYKPAFTKTEGEFCRASDPILNEWKAVARFVAAAEGKIDTIAEKEAKIKNGFPVDNLRQAMKHCGGENLPYRQIYTRPELAVARGMNPTPDVILSYDWIQAIYPNYGHKRDYDETEREYLYETPATYLVDPLLERTLNKRLQ